MTRQTAWPLFLTVLLVVTAVVSLGVGPVAVSPLRIVGDLLPISGSGMTPTEATIVWQLRLPRILLACMVGAGLGTAGAGYQGLFRNPLADPYVVGASSGAALGATLAIVTGVNGLLGLGAIPLMALAGALLAVAAVYGVATVGSEVPMLSLLLAGVAVSSLVTALMSLLMFMHDDKLIAIVGWLMGSLSGRGWQDFWTTAPLMLVGSLTLWGLSRSLDALTFGEETAASLGLRLARFRGLVVLAASLATAAAVAAAGVIGFVGLIAPHGARLLVGARHAVAIPASALLGALLLVVADDLARTVVAPAELPVGVLTALLGGPFFLYLLKTRRGAWGRNA